MNSHFRRAIIPVIKKKTESKTKNKPDDKIEIDVIGEVWCRSSEIYIGDPWIHTKDFGVIANTYYGDGFLPILLLTDDGEPKQIIIDLENMEEGID